MGVKRQGFARRRKALGYSQEQLAERLGVERSTVVRWERGTTDPQPWVRPKLLQALKVSAEELDALITHDDRQTPSTARTDTLQDANADDSVAVAELGSRVQHLAEQYDRTPSTVLLAEAGQYLGHIAGLAERPLSGQVLRALMAVEAEAATLMGQLVWDASQRSDHASADAYYDQAISAARRLRDPAAEGHALLRKSFVSLYGQRDGRAGLLLLRRAATVTRGASEVLTGLAFLHSAEAHAMLGRRRHCEKDLGAAEAELAHVEATDPAIRLYSPTQFGRLAGACYLALGNHGRARTFLETTAEGMPARKKSRPIVLGNLALAHIRDGHVDEAAGALHEAIDAVTVTRGGGGLNLVFEAGRELQPWRRARTVQDVCDRLLSLMTA